MTVNAGILADMIGPELAQAVAAAQTRLEDETITARCTAGLWLVERAGATVAGELTYDDAVAALAALA